MAELNYAEKTMKRVSDDIMEDVAKLRKDIASDKDDRQRWEDKLTIATNQRLGVNRATRLPYPGAPNIPLPETDKQIKNKTPGYVLSVYGEDKPVSINFGPAIGEVSQDLIDMKNRAEMGFNYILKNELNFLDELTIAADQFQEKGHTVFKIVEKFSRTAVQKVVDTDDFEPEMLEQIKALSKPERAFVIADYTGLDVELDSDLLDTIDSQLMDGTRHIVYTEDVVRSMPAVIVPNSEDVLVPVNTTDIETAERIRHRFYLSYRELYERALDGAYDLAKVKKLKEGKKKESSEGDSPLGENPVKDQKDMNEGLSDDERDEFQVSEVYFWRPSGKDGRYERWVVTILDNIADDDDATIQIIRFPYEFEDWNFVKHDNERRDHRYFSSRGIPEQIRALQDFMERSMNNMIIRDEINNNPMFTILKNADFDPSTMRFVPGQGLLVDSHDDVREFGGLKSSRVDMSATTIMQTLKAFMEEYLGSTDQLFRNATNRGGGKTLGEIQVGMQKAAAQQSLDLLRWNETLKRVYKKLWIILRSRLGEPISVNGVMVSKDDFNFDAEIVPTGSIEATNQIDKVQRAMTIFQLVQQQVQLGAISNAEDLYNAMYDVLVKLGEKSPERYITRPEEIAEAKMQQMQAQDQVLAQQEAALSEEEQALMQQAQQTEQTATAMQ